MLKHQHLLMAALRITKSHDDLRSAAIGMAVEASEVLDTLNKAGRVWKREEYFGDDKVVEETIDVLFYALEILVLKGQATEEQIYHLYKQKFIYNLARIFESRHSSTARREIYLAWTKGKQVSTESETLFTELRNRNYIVGSSVEWTDDELSFLSRPTVQLRRWQNDDDNQYDK